MLHGAAVSDATPAAMVHHGVARIPEDRNHVGVIGEMTVWENLISERRRDAPFSRFGLLGFQPIRKLAGDLIERFDIRCQGPQAETRLLSGGNVQKLVLARVLSTNPSVILANQPVRGLDVGAIAYVQNTILEARKNGAAVLLISEDLEELMALSDRIQVIYHGRLSEPIDARDVTARELGLMMSGQARAA
jgi:simple sugar transport system ATP-binding protein